MPARNRIMVNVTPELEEAIKEWADDEGLSTSALIKGIMEELTEERGYLKKQSILKKQRVKVSEHKT